MCVSKGTSVNNPESVTVSPVVTGLVEEASVETEVTCGATLVTTMSNSVVLVPPMPSLASTAMLTVSAPSSRALSSTEMTPVSWSIVNAPPASLVSR